MAETTTAESQHPTRNQTLFGKLYSLIFRIIGVLIFSMMISVLVEWVGMAFYYPAMGYTGYQHARDMMNSEVSYLNAAAHEDALNTEAVNNVGRYIKETTNFLFVDSGLVESLKAARQPNPNDSTMVHHTKLIVAEYYNYVMAAVYIIIMFIVRLGILILSMPVFVLFGLVGLADGLMQRDLRRWGGGRESGFIYHWAKTFSIPILILSWVIYLAIPFSIHPNLIIVPAAMIFGLVLMVMGSKFKKYL